MASRFVAADNDIIEELKTSGENLNTRKSTNLLVGEMGRQGSITKYRRRHHGDIRGSRT
jgi:hypothetical protein